MTFELDEQQLQTFDIERMAVMAKYYFNAQLNPLKCNVRAIGEKSSFLGYTFRGREIV